MKGKVIGIGGIFFVAQDPERLKAWYKKHLGIGSFFFWNQLDSGKPAYTAWNVFESSSPLFKNYQKPYLWNYTVDDLPALLAKLKEKGVIASALVEDANGKHVTLQDIEMNNIILWEPSALTPEAEAPGDRVTGLGGLFFKSADVPALKEWYKQNLGFEFSEWGCSFKWTDSGNPDAKEAGETAWSVFKDNTDHFNPSTKPFMLNYRVKDLSALIKDLDAEGVEMVGDLEEYPFGKFGRIMDIEGNKIELWQPLEHEG